MLNVIAAAKSASYHTEKFCSNNTDNNDNDNNNNNNNNNNVIGGCNDSLVITVGDHCGKKLWWD